MLTENTITKLREMRLGTMADAFKEQLADPNIAELSFEDRFGLLVDREWTTRKNNHLARLIKNAHFSEPNACVEDISYSSGRKLDKAQISRLASCNFIFEHHNLMLLGATGCGKTYIGLCAGNGCGTSVSDCTIRQTPRAAYRACHCKNNGHFQQSDREIQKAGFAHS